MNDDTGAHLDAISQLADDHRNLGTTWRAEKLAAEVPWLIVELNHLLRQADRLTSAIARVRERHHDWNANDPDREPECAECQRLYPCPTIRTLEADSSTTTTESHH